MGQRDQPFGQPDVKTLKRNLVDHQKKVGDPLGKRGKHEIPEGF